MYKAFLHLLKVALGQSKELPQKLSRDEWEVVWSAAQRQTLVGVLFAGVERLPVEQRPSRELLLRWFSYAERIKQNNRLLNQRAVETIAYFKKEGFESCILKGQGVATYYPNPLLRTSGDIDIWLSGGRVAILDFARAKVGLQGMTYHHIHYPLFDDAEVEVHITPAYLSCFGLNRNLQHYFKETFTEQNGSCVELPEGVGKIPHPTAEFDLLFLLLHMYKHLIGQGIGLRQMMDYYYVLQQPISEEERQRVICRLRELKVMRFARATMYVMREVFGLGDELLLVEVDEKAGAFLLSEMMQAGNFGKFDARLERRHNETAWFRLVRSLKRNIRFLRYFPNEVLWNPVFRTWQYFWRLGIKRN